MKLRSFLFLMILFLSFSPLFCVLSLAWDIYPVDPVWLDGNIQIANDPISDQPFIVYMDHDDLRNNGGPKMKLAHNTSSGWQVNSIESFTEYFIADWDANISFHPLTKVPYVVYFDKDWNLKIGYPYSGLSNYSYWKSKIIDFNIRSFTTSFAFDHYGIPWITYNVSDGNRISTKIAFYDKSKLNFIKFDNICSTTFAIDPSTGRPAFAYYKIDSYNPAQARLCYTYFNGSVWKSSIVDKNQYSYWQKPSIAFNPITKSPSIAYSSGFNEYGETLKYAYFSNGQWNISIIDSNYVWGQISLAYNPINNQPSILYAVDYSHSDPNMYAPLIYAYSDGNNWHYDIVYSSNNTNLIYESSLVFSKDGKARIAFNGEGLKYATQ